MATYISGGVRKATANTREAQRRSAERRTCPSCLRRSALKSHRQNLGDHLEVIEWCRWTEVKKDGTWPYCDYRDVRSIPISQ